MKKRAEIDGDLRQAAKRIAELRADRDVIDAAIRVFDPSRIPHEIKPHLRRPKPRLFRHGECSRAILNILRMTPDPISTREIMDRMISEYHLDLTAPDDREVLLHKVRNTLSRHAGRDLIREDRGGVAYWAMMEDEPGGDG